MDRSDGQKRIEAGRKALPTPHQATIRLLEPGTGPLGLKPWHHFFDRSATRRLRLPDALGKLRPNPALASRLPQRLGVLPFLRREDLETFPGAAPLARADLDRIEQGHDLGALIPLGWGGPVRSRHTAPIGEAVEEDPFALPPASNARATSLPRGKKRRQRRHTPTASALLPL